MARVPHLPTPDSAVYDESPVVVPAGQPTQLGCPISLSPSHRLRTNKTNASWHEKAMHLGGLDLNLLVALDALLREKNVTRAAERIYISQPGMSAALQKLREHFSDQLLERVGRKFELTPRGRELAGRVTDILLTIKSLDESLEQFDHRTAHRVFRVSASTYCSDLLAVPVIEHLAEAAPNVSCQFDDLTSETVSRVIDGRLDFAITISLRLLDTAAIQEKSLSETPLFTDHMVLVVADGNTAVGDSITFDELCKMPYAETRFSNDILGIGERVWQQLPQSPRVRAWLPNFHLTLDALSRSNLIAMLPARLVAAKKSSFRVRTLPVPFDVPKLEETIFWHPRNQADSGHLWFRDLLKLIAKEQGLTS
jgi:LysR family transcriptional regulator, nod-box dependent transcriptional activator